MVSARLSTEEAATFLTIASARAHEVTSFFVKYLHDVDGLVYLALASVLEARPSESTPFKSAPLSTVFVHANPTRMP